MKATFGDAEHDNEVMHEAIEQEAPITVFDQVGKVLGVISCIVIAYGIITAF